MTKAEATKALTGAVSILGVTADTVRVLHDTLLKFRERKVRFIVEGATVPDAETDRDFDNVVELLRLMGESIPVQLAAAILKGKGAGEVASQNAPTVDTVH